MVCFPKVFYKKVKEEDFPFKKICELLKDVFICLKQWDTMLKKFSNEVYKGRYSLWFATNLDLVL
jgi:hypothetical protein